MTVKVHQLTRLLECVMELAVLVEYYGVCQTKAQHHHHQRLGVRFCTLLSHWLRYDESTHATCGDQEGFAPDKVDACSHGATVHVQHGHRRVDREVPPKGS